MSPVSFGVIGVGALALRGIVPHLTQDDIRDRVVLHALCDPVLDLVLVFVLCLGFYITPELLGGGRTFLISTLVSRNVELYNQFGAASAVAVVLLLSVLLIFVVVSRFISLDRILGQK